MNFEMLYNSSFVRKCLLAQITSKLLVFLLSLFNFNRISIRAQLLFLIGQDLIWCHASFQAQIVPAFFAVATSLHSYFTFVVFLTLKVRSFCLLMGSSEECSTAEASNSAIMRCMGSRRFLLANWADFVVLLNPSQHVLNACNEKYRLSHTYFIALILLLQHAGR